MFLEYITFILWLFSNEEKKRIQMNIFEINYVVLLGQTLFYSLFLSR